MKKVYIDGQICIGPNFSESEFDLIKRNLDSVKGLETLAGLLEVAGNEQRLKILYLLHTHKEMCVCDLAQVLKITDSAVSQHLRKLKDKSLVQNRRHKQTIFYFIKSNQFNDELGKLFEMTALEEKYAFQINL